MLTRLTIWFLLLIGWTQAARAQDTAGPSPRGAEPAVRPSDPSPEDASSDVPAEKPRPHARPMTANQMIRAIVQKNMFRPGRELPPETVLTAPIGPGEPQLKKLTRPFRLSAIDEIGGQPRAHLFFGNIRRTVQVGDEIEFLTVTRINVRPPYLVCDYGGNEVRIDIGETSDDALLRLTGFSDIYEFIGTQIVGDHAFATVLTNGKYHRVEVGDRLGSATVFKIENGKMWLRFDDGFEFDLEPEAKAITP